MPTARSSSSISAPAGCCDRARPCRGRRTRSRYRSRISSATKRASWPGSSHGTRRTLSPAPRAARSVFWWRLLALCAMAALATSSTGRVRAVVVLELDDLGALEVRLELQDVAHVGAAEGVDGLVVVAHHAHVALLVGEQQQRAHLADVGVLELVDQDVAKALLPLLAHMRGASRGCAPAAPPGRRSRPRACGAATTRTAGRSRARPRRTRSRSPGCPRAPCSSFFQQRDARQDGAGVELARRPRRCRVWRISSRIRPSASA